MATTAVGPKTCTIKIGFFSGRRQPLASGEDVLLTVHDGNQQQVFRDYIKKPSFTLPPLPFHNNFGDNYNVVAWAKGYAQAGFTLLKLTPERPVVLDVMLVHEDAQFNFSQARWDAISGNSLYGKLLAAGSANPQVRYTELLENRSPVLACFFNLATAMSQIYLHSGTPLTYVRELIWDQTMAKDRFFAWADPALVDEVAVADDLFAPEWDPGACHPGATHSYKQTKFGEANVQLTFHEKDTRIIDGLKCIKLEPDIDYYKDPLAHVLFEVAANALSGSKTDPRRVYVLRWMAGRQTSIPEFDPPYWLE